MSLLLGRIVTSAPICGFQRAQIRLLSILEMKKSKSSVLKSSKKKLNNDLDELITKLQNVHLSTSPVTQKKARKCHRSNVLGFCTLSPKNGLEVKSLEDVAAYLKKSSTRRVVVMAGAGISTLSGIPDFRTPGTGLYDNLHKYNLPYPEAIFELDYFQRDPRAFFTLAKELYPGNYKPNAAHYFVKLLHEKGKLLRMYTQNIDGLERLAGIPSEKLVEAHGTFKTATCRKCGESYQGGDIKDEIFAGNIPKCHKKKCGGVIKPDIVFFGEQLPEQFWLHNEDMSMTDLLIVMGTSLVVEPFASIAELVNAISPRLLLNKSAVGTFVYGQRPNDVVEKGDVAQGLQKFANLLGWTEELNALCNKH